MKPAHSWFRFGIVLAALAPFFLAGLAAADSTNGAGAEKTMRQWLTLAQQRKWSEMVPLTTFTWRSQEKDKAPKSIALLYDFLTIKSWKITGQKEHPEFLDVPNVFFVFDIEAETEQAGTQVMKAAVICESAPFHPDPNGTCGVNPDTAMFGLKPGTKLPNAP